MCRPRDSRSRRWAFSLLEMMMAVVILGAGVVAVMQGLGGTMEANRRLEDRMVAGQLLELKLAEYEGLNQPMEAQEGAFEGEHAKYRWKAEAFPTDFQGLVEIRVEVMWPGRRTTRHLSAQMLGPQR